MGKAKISEFKWRQFYWDHLSGLSVVESAKKHRISQGAAYGFINSKEPLQEKIKRDIEGEIWSVMNRIRAEKLAEQLETLNDDYMTSLLNISKLLRQKTEAMVAKAEADPSKPQMIRKREAIRATKAIAMTDEEGNPIINAQTGKQDIRQSVVFTEKQIENDLDTLTSAYQKLMKPLQETMSNAKREGATPKLSG